MHIALGDQIMTTVAFRGCIFIPLPSQREHFFLCLFQQRDYIQHSPARYDR